MMGPALTDLGLQSQTTLLFTGTEDHGGTVTAVSSRVSVFRQTTGTSTATWIEMVSFRGPTLQSRVVATGSRMWFYNALRNEYSAWNYGAVTDPDKAMLLTLKRWTTGYDNLIAQILVEANDGRNNGSLSLTSKWLPWMPLAQVSTSTGVVQCVSSVPDYKQVTYNITEPVPGDYRLDRVDLYSERKSAGSLVVTNANVQVFRDTLVPATDFSFDPGNAKLVALGLRQGG